MTFKENKSVYIYVQSGIAFTPQLVVFSTYICINWQTNKSNKKKKSMALTRQPTPLMGNQIDCICRKEKLMKKKGGEKKSFSWNFSFGGWIICSYYGIFIAMMCPSLIEFCLPKHMVQYIHLFNLPSLQSFLFLFFYIFFFIFSNPIRVLSLVISLIKSTVFFYDAYSFSSFLCNNPNPYSSHLLLF